MYNIEKTSFGYKLTFGGAIDEKEITNWYNESKKQLESAPASFGVLIDMRELQPLLPEAQKIMVDGQGLYKNKGMQRSAVILNNAVTTMQFKRLAKDSGIFDTEKYINAAENPGWEKAAVDWLANGVDPY